MKTLKRKIEMIIRILFNRNCVLFTYDLSTKDSHYVIDTKYELIQDVSEIKRSIAYISKDIDYTLTKNHSPMPLFNSEVCNICGKTVSEHFK